MVKRLSIYIALLLTILHTTLTYPELGDRTNGTG
jgi:hypothetical protein